MVKPSGIAVVTGASRGIGPVIARAMAETGYSIVVTGRSAPELESVAASLKTGGATALAVPADLTDIGSRKALVKTVEQELGPVEVWSTTPEATPSESSRSCPGERTRPSWP